MTQLTYVGGSRDKLTTEVEPWATYIDVPVSVLPLKYERYYVIGNEAIHQSRVSDEHKQDISRSIPINDLVNTDRFGNEIL